MKRECKKFAFFVLAAKGQAYDVEIRSQEACPMKKLLGILLTFIVLYAIYFDLTTGTLPHADSQKAEAMVETESKISAIPYFTAKVEPGETVITIVEHQLKKPLPVSITKLVRDFDTLNSGQNAEKIQVGRTYRFPDYLK